MMDADLDNRHPFEVHLKVPPFDGVIQCANVCFLPYEVRDFIELIRAKFRRLSSACIVR